MAPKGRFTSYHIIIITIFCFVYIIYIYISLFIFVYNILYYFIFIKLQNHLNKCPKITTNTSKDLSPKNKNAKISGTGYGTFLIIRIRKYPVRCGPQKSHKNKSVKNIKVLASKNAAFS